MVRQPLAATETADKFDILILADGGGVAGQAGAARLGVARALVEFNAELRSKLKKLGFLTRDPRAARAQEVRPKGRPQAVPVLQTIVLAEPARAGLPVVNISLPLSGPRANLALDRAREAATGDVFPRDSVRR
jgi:hypothetical protein